MSNSPRDQRRAQHQDKLLAAVYSLHQKNLSTGRGTRIDFANTLVKERHKEIPVTQLSDGILKLAKHALIDTGDLIPVNGPVNTLSDEAVQGIRSWKQRPEIDAQDDEQAAARYLERGAKAGFVAPKVPKPKKTVSTPRSPRRTSKTRSTKGKEKAVSSDEEYESSEGEELVEKGKKRGQQDEASRASKKAKVVVKDQKADKGKKSKKDGEANVIEMPDKTVKGKGKGKGKSGTPEDSTKIAPKRKTGPAGPGIHSLNKADLIKKIRELEDAITVSKNEMEVDSQGDENENDEDRNPDDGQNETGDLPRGRDRVEGDNSDDDELSELEESDLEEETRNDARTRVSLPLSQDPLRVTSSSSTALQPHRAQSLDKLPPLPLRQASVSALAPRDQWGVSDRQSQLATGEVGRIRQPPEHAKSMEEVTAEHERTFQEGVRVGMSIGLGPKPMNENGNNVIEGVEGSDDPADSDDGDTSSIADKTLVEGGHIVEDDEKSSLKAFLDAQCSGYVQSRPGPSKYDKEEKESELSSSGRTSSPDQEVLKQLEAATEEIAKLKSIRNELVRERNDATEEKANLRRKFEEQNVKVQRLAAISQGASESERAQARKSKIEIDEMNKKLQADQQTISALTKDLSALESEKEELERKVEQQQANLDQVERALIDTETKLEEGVASLELRVKERVQAILLETKRLEDELRTAQEDLRQSEEERQNEVDEVSKEYRAKHEELQSAKSAYSALQLDVINLAVSCSLRVDDTASPKSIINDFKTRHLSLVQQLAEQRARSLQISELARSSLQLVSPGIDVPLESTLEDLLKSLAVRVNDVVRQAQQGPEISSNASGLVQAISELVVAGGGVEVPTSFAEVPKAIQGIQTALIEKNTTILRLEARLEAAETNLGEANLAHKTLERSLEQIQGELGDKSRLLDHA